MGDRRAAMNQLGIMYGGRFIGIMYGGRFIGIRM
jgi:hypothetical protein